jgi:hypothetical protein
MAVKKNKIAYHPDELSQKQIDEMFDRFALPLIQSSVTPLNGDYAHVISHILWICFILEKDINHELSNKLHGLPEWNHDFNINTITLCFVQMKASLTDSEIKCLRRYFSNPLNLHQLLHLYLDEMEAYRTKNSLPEAVTILTDAQIQSLYDRFSAPISKGSSSQRVGKGVGVVRKCLPSYPVTIGHPPWKYLLFPQGVCYKLKPAPASLSASRPVAVRWQLPCQLLLRQGQLHCNRTKKFGRGGITR